MTGDINGTGIWKYLTTFFGGILITLTAVYFTSQRDVVTRRELSEQTARYDKQFQDNARQIDDLTKSVQLLTNNVAVLSEDLRLSVHPNK